jgi:hypothetical protein
LCRSWAGDAKEWQDPGGVAGAAAIAADLGVDQTDLQPQVAAAAAVNALRGAFMAWFLSGASGDPQPPFDQALNLLEHGLGTLSAAASHIPAPRPPKPLRATPDQATRLRNPARADMPRHQTTPATASGLPADPWDAVSHQLTRQASEAFPGDNPMRQVGRAISITNHG